MGIAMRRQHNRLSCLIASILLILPSVPALAADDAPSHFVEITAETPAPLPEIQLFDTSGKQVMPDFSASKLTILHFWATWCLPCLGELPELDNFSARYQSRGVRVAAISLDVGKPEQVQAFYARLSIANLNPVLFDHTTSALRALNGDALPMSVFVNAAGQEIARSSGATDWNSSATKDFIETALQ
jgi:thiol-disulfide isomerase/thioredoxin